ncbi:MAG: hypothetical protein F6K19_40610 [Cyanothece sp. SIO1E1]|nr:hypothetical protein [Cyanothece sp. SIO1E1]
MKGNRTKAILQFLVLVLLFPFCFFAFRHVVEAMLTGFSWDNATCAWIDKALGIPPPEELIGHSRFLRRSLLGGSHRWLTDILALPSTFWHIWFLLGAVSEISHLKRITALSALEIFARWFAIASVTLTLPVGVGVLFFHSIAALVWSPLAILASVALGGFFWIWGLKLPGKRIRKVEAIYHFEKVKEVKL